LRLLEMLSTASKIYVHGCSGCRDEAIIIGSTVHLLVREPCGRQVAEVARSLLANVKQRGELRDAITTLAEILVTGLVGLAIGLLDPLLGFVAFVAIAAAMLARKALARRKQGSGAEGDAAAAVVEVVAYRLEPLLEAYCTKCSVKLVGYTCSYSKTRRTAVIELAR
jgi:hypothetical protein